VSVSPEFTDGDVTSCRAQPDGLLEENPSNARLTILLRLGNKEFYNFNQLSI
jgi:hypothetical protein